MKFNLPGNSMRIMAAGTMAIFFSSSLIAPAFADNKTADSKKIESAAGKTIDADFKKLDTNTDGKISLKEAVKDKALASVFDMTDADHDGMVSAEEYVNYKSALSTINKEGTNTTN